MKDWVIEYLNGNKGDTVISIFPSTNSIRVTRVQIGETFNVEDEEFYTNWNSLSKEEKVEVLQIFINRIV